MGSMQVLCKMALAGLAALGLWGASLLPAMAGNSGNQQGFSIERVIAFASRSMAEDYTISIQWYGHMDEAQSAGLKEQLQPGFLLVESAAGVVSLSSAGEGSRLRGSWSRLSGSHTGEVFLRLEADGTDARALAEAGSRVDGWLREAGAAGDWSVKAAGVWSGDAALHPEEEVSGLARTLLAAEKLETYKDQGIVNTLYKTELIGFKAEGTEAGFQTALHRNSETGGWNLAVGAPMLTGEF
jgi:hypothetical protein